MRSSAPTVLAVVVAAAVGVVASLARPPQLDPWEELGRALGLPQKDLRGLPHQQDRQTRLENLRSW